jgi:hypothetical protein
MFIDNNGLMGFSTNVPLAKLYVLETGSTDAFRVDDQDSDTTPFIIKADGLVGIGTTSPGAILEVHSLDPTAFTAILGRERIQIFIFLLLKTELQIQIV